MISYLRESEITVANNNEKYRKRNNANKYTKIRKIMQKSSWNPNQLKSGTKFANWCGR